MSEYDDTVTDVSATALGLSFSGQDILFAEVERTPQQFQIRNIGAVKTNLKFGTGIEAVEKNIRDIYPYLNGCVEDNGIQARWMNISLNSNLACLQKISVDSDSADEDFRRHVQWEFGQYVSGDFDDYVVNTCDMKAAGDGFLSSLLVVGIRRRYAETLQAVLEKFRLNFSCLDVDILCAHATYEVNHDRCPDGMTALVEAKPGVTTVLLCNDYDPEYIFQFPTPAKSTPTRLASFIGPFLDNMIHLYNAESGKSGVLGRTIVTGPFCTAVAPQMEARYRASAIQSTGRIVLDPKYNVQETPAADEGDDNPHKPKIKVEPVDYAPYAECIGAAIKMLVN